MAGKLDLLFHEPDLLPFLAIGVDAHDVDFCVNSSGSEQFAFSRLKSSSRQNAIRHIFAFFRADFILLFLKFVHRDPSAFVDSAKLVSVAFAHIKSDLRDGYRDALFLAGLLSFIFGFRVLAVFLVLAFIIVILLISPPVRAYPYSQIWRQN